MKKLLLGVSILLMMASCSQKVVNQEENQGSVETHVLHAPDVDPKSPSEVIEILKSGNRHFVEKHLSNRDAMAQLIESANDGQHPLAIVLSCIDSRVPVETIFDKGVGDLFVARVAGNIVNPDILGSMEYACEHSGSKVVVVLGHECCGAVHSACEHVDAGNMTQMLAKIQPAIDSCAQVAKVTDTPEFENEVMRKNVELMVNRVRNESEILSHMEHEGKILIVGAVFNLHSGLVEFIL
ncbi:MAG: carbonic anhydrase family protein [Bacteroidales bacterium]